MHIVYITGTVSTQEFQQCMNAVMRDYDIPAGTDMPANENDGLAIQVAELRADVRHLQSDVTDIKADVRTSKQSIEALRKETYETFTQIRESLSSAKIWALGLYIALAGSLAHGFKWI